MQIRKQIAIIFVFPLVALGQVLGRFQLKSRPSPSLIAVVQGGQVGKTITIPGKAFRMLIEILAQMALGNTHRHYSLSC